MSRGDTFAADMGICRVCSGPTYRRNADGLPECPWGTHLTDGPYVAPPRAAAARPPGSRATIEAYLSTAANTGLCMDDPSDRATLAAALDVHVADIVAARIEGTIRDLSVHRFHDGWRGHRRGKGGLHRSMGSLAKVLGELLDPRNWTPERDAGSAKRTGATERSEGKP